MSRAVIQTIDRDVLDPMFRMFPANYDSLKARLMLLTIGLQESRLTERKQIGGGPARGLWQFERGGGVRGVFKHHSTEKRAVEICDALQVPATVEEVYQTLQYDDVLAAAFARMLLWTDPFPLPEPGEVEEAWVLYAERLWNPGKPHRHTWDELYAEALAYLRSKA